MPQTITPYLLYEDVATMLGWLSRAFGLTETLRFNAEDGSVNHAEMQIGDVDAHYAQAQTAGAEIRLELHDTEYGDRRYDAYDPEGHLWSFATPVRNMAPAEWGAQEA